MINLLGHKFGREWKLENAEDEEEIDEGEEEDEKDRRKKYMLDNLIINNRLIYR